MNCVFHVSVRLQVRFSSNQQKTVLDVISGDADVGMVRTDMVEGMVSEGLIANGSVRVLENLQGKVGARNFPFPFSTHRSAPEWALAQLPWMKWDVSLAVRACQLTCAHALNALTLQATQDLNN